MVNWKPAIALFGASTGLVIDGWKVEQELGYVGLGANAKTPGAANLSSLTRYSTVHNPVKASKTWHVVMPSYIGVYICVLPSYTLTDVHALRCGSVIQVT